MPSRTVEKVLWGTAAALMCSWLLPRIRQAIRPLSGMGSESASDLGDRAKYMWAVTREGLEDIVAEAQFERMRKKFEREIADSE